MSEGALEAYYFEDTSKIYGKVKAAISWSAVRFGVLTVSDTCFSNPSQDISGSTAVGLLRQHGFTITLQNWVPDDSLRIGAVLSNWIGSTQVDVIVTIGGTGITARDVTTETVLRLLHDGRRLSGLEHALYAVSFRHTPMAALSRLVAGVISSVLVVTLPGSPKAVSECVPVLYPIVKHAVDQIKGLSTGHSRSGLDTVAVPVRSYNNTSSEVRCVADRPRESPFPMVSVKEAQAKIFGLGSSMLAGLQVEPVFYQNALGRVLGCSLKSQVCIPPYDASVMDGYAVRFSDQSRTLRVLGALRAGDSMSTDHLVVSTGTCVRVNTGGPLPVGADAVVPVEHTRLVSRCYASSADLSIEESVIEVSSPPTHSGQFIRPAGSDLTTEDVFKRGFRLNPANLGVLAGAGLLTPFSTSQTSRFLMDNQNELLPPAVMSILSQGGYLPCIKQPCIGILSTGNELVDGLGSPGPLSILDSNRPVLMSLLRKHGFVNLLDLGIARDHEGALELALRHAFDRCDIVVATGGMSMGEQDLVASVLTDRFGAVMHFSRVNLPDRHLDQATAILTLPSPTSHYLILGRHPPTLLNALVPHRWNSLQFGFGICDLFRFKFSERQPPTPSNLSTVSPNSIARCVTGRSVRTCPHLMINLFTPHHVVVRVQEASLNPIDLLTIYGYGASTFRYARRLGSASGLLGLFDLDGSEHADFPITPGRDFAGHIVGLGPSASTSVGLNRIAFTVGQRVAGATWPFLSSTGSGSLAEYIVCPLNYLAPVPDKVTSTEATAVGYAGLTAWSALVAGGLTPHAENRVRDHVPLVLIVGASGGVGLIAAQLAKLWGARVHVTCPGDVQAQTLMKQLPVEDVIVHPDRPALTTRYDAIVNCIRPNASEITMNCGGGMQSFTKFLCPDTPHLFENLKSHPNARYVILNSPAMSLIDRNGLFVGANLAMVKLIYNQLFFWCPVNPDARLGQLKWAFFQPSGKRLSYLLQLVSDGQLKVFVDHVFPFDEVPEAFARLRAKGVRGKIIVRVHD
ncbi:gephyrin [Paragonimus westermani]|uniref:Gephyrin n=1 Tax=Paragonimus westermani TaxID=34504 RepID=A0A5J4NL19_9TREM|nr:gephyrin [Paragonimus westermani]